MRARKSVRSSVPAVISVLVITVLASAHVTVRPRESAAGAAQKYMVRVPNEKTVPTVRIEAEFPANVEISSLEEKPGWKIEAKKNAAGKITGAIWSGSSIAPREAVEFGVLARNPDEETKLVWKVVQIYDDGTRSEWTGEQGSRTPAPVTLVKKTSPSP